MLYQRLCIVLLLLLFPINSLAQETYLVAYAGFAGFQAPRPGRDAARGEADRFDAVVPHPGGYARRHDGKLERGPVAQLEIV